MPSSAVAVLGALLLQSPTASPPVESVVVERVLAVVDHRPVLLSEVAMVERLRSVDRKAALELLIDELLMYGEARRFPQARPTAAQATAATESLLQQYGQAADEAELRRVALRQATILKYVGLRFGPLVRVSDEAVRQAYEQAHAGHADAPDLATVAGEIRGRLTRRELDARVEEWTRRLRASATIEYLASDSAPSP